MTKNMQINKGSYPFNLLDMIVLRPLEELPEDYALALEYVLLDIKRQNATGVEMLLNRYRDAMEWDQIGQKYGISDMEAEDSVMQCICMIRHPSRSNFIIYGFAEMLKQAEELGRCLGYSDGYKKGLAVGLSKVAHIEGINNLAALKIRDMNLPIRIINSLHRANLRTATDIFLLNYQELRKIKNLGDKSINEIVKCMQLLGVKTKHLEPPQS